MVAVKAMNALLVEDENLDAELMGKYLIKLGCEVTTVKTGSGAIEALDRQTFNFVICDINLSDDIGGFELLKHARRSKDHIEMPIVLVTASNVSSEMFTELRQYGGVDICQKWDGVIQKVRDFVQSYKEEYQLRDDRMRLETQSSNPFNRIRRFIGRSC